MPRQYSDTCPTTTLVGPGGGVATGLTNVGTAMELSSSIAGFLTPPFVLGLEPGTPNEELVMVTAGAGSSGSPYTIVRGQGTTSAVAHTTGVAVAHRIGSDDFKTAYTGIVTGGSTVGASSTSEVSMGDICTLAPNDCLLAAVFPFFVGGQLTFGAGTLTIRARAGGLGGALLGPAMIITPTANASWVFDGMLMIRLAGASGNIGIAGSLTTATAAGATLAGATQGAAGSINLTTPTTITLTAQYGTSNASNGINIGIASVQKFL